ncbi:MAG: HPr(Ser) kinase/phosphatase [Sulfuricellaceae bacterium]
MPQISVQQMFDKTCEKLALKWVGGNGGGARLLTGDSLQTSNLALIGHLNFIHPNRLQVLGCAEMAYLRNLNADSLAQAITKLFSDDLAAIIVTNGEEIPPILLDTANAKAAPLFASTQPSPRLMGALNHYLTQVLAERILVQGVFMEVQGMGVLITGDSAIGKSELALEMVTRGHRLIADDIVEFYQVSPDTLEGRCPPLLQDFLEVRGLGILNIRAMFGEAAVKLIKNLKLIVQLEKLAGSDLASRDRLQLQEYSETILSVTVPKVRIPVASGRNIAVLAEVAVRNHILRLRGINSTFELMARHEKLMLDNAK